MGVKMFFLWKLVVITCVLAFHTAEGGIILTATPQRINALVTKNFILNCTYEGKDENFLFLKLLKMITKGPAAGTLKELITMHANSSFDILSPSTTQVRYIGGVRGKSKAYLSGTWTRVPKGFGGNYECIVSFVDATGCIKGLHRQIRVKEDKATFAHSMEATEKLQRSEDKFQEWTKRMGLAFNLLHTAVLKGSYTRPYKNKFYIVYNHAPGHVRTAEAFCRIRGGYLAELNDFNEWKFVTSFIDRLGKTRMRFYVSGRRNPFSGQFYWPRLGMGRPAYFNWNPGQPNNTGYSQTCVDLFKPYQWRMTDFWCNGLESGFICEVPWAKRDV